MIRAVIDTSVLVSAFIGHPGAAPAEVVAAWRDRRFTLIMSPHLLGELTEVLARPKLARWADEGRGAAYATAFGAQAELHADVAAEPATRDPSDDYLIALARSADADLLVSVDRDLTEAHLDDITVVTPAGFLAGLGPRA